MGLGGLRKTRGAVGIALARRTSNTLKLFVAPLLFLHFSLPPLSPPLQLEASSFSGVGWGHAPDGEGGGGGSSELGSGGLRGRGNSGAIGLIAPRRPPRPVGGRGIPKACLERRGYAGLRLSHFGICNSRQQRGWGAVAGDLVGEAVELAVGCGPGRGLSGGEGLSKRAPRPGRILAVAAVAPAWPERPGLPRRAPGLPLTRLSPYPFLPRPVPLPAPRRRRAGAAAFPSRRPVLSLSPGPAGDVSHTCAEDAPVTGEEAAAGGGAGGERGHPLPPARRLPGLGRSRRPRTRPRHGHPPSPLPTPPPPTGARPRPAPPVCSALRAPLQPAPHLSRSQAGFGNALTAAG